MKKYILAHVEKIKIGEDYEQKSKSRADYNSLNNINNYNKGICYYPEK